MLAFRAEKAFNFQGGDLEWTKIVTNDNNVLLDKYDMKCL